MLSLKLPNVKAHLRVDYDDEDSLIEGYIFAAIEYAIEFCNIRMPADPDDLPEGLKIGILLLVGKWFENRADSETKYASSKGPVPDDVSRIFWLYKTVTI